VGNFGGTTTLRAIARYLKSEDAVVAAFYTSNVEGYLRGEAKTQFAANVAALPRTERSVFVRTWFHQVGATKDRPDYSTKTEIEFLKAYVDSFSAL
jgi:hypothetical protein